MTETHTPGYGEPEIVEVGDATELTGTSVNGNVSDGPPHGVGYRPGTRVPEDAPEAE